ncbi:unnamed protein product [Phaedon cochleariae]|uniref:C2H2-type domain-containing protein n=1 Tax=Phaedon cochleariae TaxID=80249 RepID=A0A9P0DM89_PHACE|nr:unnamed protein product [Phaedon cochleariae]
MHATIVHILQRGAFRYKNVGKDSEGRFSCQKCSSSYKRKTHLIRHIDYECGVEPKFHCDLCSKKFKRKSTLSTHRFLVHRVH